MNNRGQMVFYLMMLAVIVIILAIALANPLKEFVNDARAPSSDTAVGLDCNNSTISDFQKAQCTLTDLSLPYFIIGLVGLAGIIIGAKLFIDGGTA